MVRRNVNSVNEDDYTSLQRFFFFLGHNSVSIIGQVWSGGTAATSHGYTILYPGSNTRVMFLCDAVTAGLAEAAPVGVQVNILL